MVKLRITTKRERTVYVITEGKKITIKSNDDDAQEGSSPIQMTALSMSKGTDTVPTTSVSIGSTDKTWTWQLDSADPDPVEATILWYYKSDPDVVLNCYFPFPIETNITITFQGASLTKTTTGVITAEGIKDVTFHTSGLNFTEKEAVSIKISQTSNPAMIIQVIGFALFDKAL